MYDQTIPLVQAQVNLFADTYKPAPLRTLPLTRALDAIRLGRYRQQVAAVRQAAILDDQEAYTRLKHALPAITFCGTFTPTRALTHLQHHSGIVHGDLDYIVQVESFKRTLASDPHTAYVFTSPTGHGVKVGVAVEVVPDDPHYKRVWQAVADAYQHRYGVPWDPSGKDVSRLCYVSHDPELYLNLNAEVFDVPPAPPPEPRPSMPRYASMSTPVDDQDYGAQAIRTAVDMIQSALPGGRHHARLKASRLIGGFVGGGLLSYSEALLALSNALDGYTDDVSGALKTVVAGLAYGEAYPITKAQKDAERQAWIEAHKPPTRLHRMYRPYFGLRVKGVRFAR